MKSGRSHDPGRWVTRRSSRNSWIAVSLLLVVVLATVKTIRDARQDRAEQPFLAAVEGMTPAAPATPDVSPMDGALVRSRIRIDRSAVGASGRKVVALGYPV